MPLYLMPSNPYDEPILTVAQFFHGKGLTKYQLKVAERIASQSWTSLYGRTSKEERLEGRHISFPLSWLEEIELAMLGKEDKTQAFERMGQREILTRMTEIGRSLERMATRAPLPNILFHPSSGYSYSAAQSPERHHIEYLEYVNEVLPEVVELWCSLLEDRGQKSIMRAILGCQNADDKAYYSGVVVLCRRPLLESPEVFIHTLVAWYGGCPSCLWCDPPIP